jgi:hypothetical protein
MADTPERVEVNPPAIFSSHESPGKQKLRGLQF